MTLNYRSRGGEDLKQAKRTAAIPQAVKIDFTRIPAHVREELAEATLNSVKEFLQQPGGREFLDAMKSAAASAAK